MHRTCAVWQANLSPSRGPVSGWGWRGCTVFRSPKDTGVPRLRTGRPRTGSVLRAYGSSLGPRVRGLGVLAIFFRVALVQFDGMRPGIPAAPNPEVEELDED